MQRTSSPRAIRAVVMATFGTRAHNLAIDVLGAVGIDVPGAAAPVRDFGGAHCLCVLFSYRGQARLGLGYDS